MTAAPRSRSWVAPALAGGLLVVFASSLTLTHLLERRVGATGQGAIESAGLVLGLAVFVLVGALLTWRQPRNPMGWLFVGITLLVATAPLGPAYVDLILHEGGHPTAGLAMLAGINNWYWIVLLGLVFVFVPLLFPDGRLPSRRWRPIVWIAIASMVTFAVGGVLAEEITTQGLRRSLPNPIGVSGLAHPEESWIGLVSLIGLATAFVGAGCSLVVRFRQARGQERTQIKWLVFAVVVVFACMTLGAVVPEDLPLLAESLFGIAFLALPVSITVAILRYRLYAIDRIISRTISYAVVVAVLVATYAVAVVLLGRLLAPLGAGNDLAVAAATLAAAAMFRPLLVRIRAVVDRRFHRARYDAHQAVASFAAGLRDQVDLDELGTEVVDVVGRTLQPAHASLWIPRSVG